MEADEKESIRGAEVLDVSGLEAPEPLVRVLERLGAIDDGGYLRVLHRREPCLLYSRLEQRGFDHRSCVTGHDFHIFIWRKGDREAEKAVRVAMVALCGE